MTKSIEVNTATTKINKKTLCFAVLAEHIQEVDGIRSFNLARKDLIELCHQALLDGGVDRLDIKPNLVTSYIQMGRMEFITQTGAYAHHKYVKKESTNPDKAPENIIPADAKWQASKDDTTEYFKTRTAAREMAAANGDDWTIAKIAA